ncbi:MAG: glycosyltransferase family 9 protein [Planctomycetota bacterium]|jgi:lipopolysaccharide heptosyltransferase I
MIQSDPELRSKPNRILLIKPSALGDVVTGLPLLRGLRRSFPNAHISWLIRESCAALVRHDSQLDDVILFDRRKCGRAWRSVSGASELGRLLARLKAGKFDWVIDLQGLLRSGLFAFATRAPLRAGFADAREGAPMFYTHRMKVDVPHTVDRNIALARQLDIDARSEDMHLEVSAAGEQFSETLCRNHDLQRGKFLIFAPTTTWKTKLYPLRYWRKVAEDLSRNVPVVLIAGSNAFDRDFCRRIAEDLRSNVIDLSGKTSVDEMVALIATAGGVICCDSAAKFIAPAVGVDSITLIGPTQVQQTGPYLRGRGIVADVPCQGCLKRRCRHITCMQTIEPAAVVAAAETMLNGHNEPCD